MNAQRQYGLTAILGSVAALLAFTAVAITYSTTGKIAVTPLGGGVMMVLLAIGAYSKAKKAGT